MRNRCHYQTPIGSICIEEEINQITALYIEEAGSGDCETACLKLAYQQLMEYFAGTRQTFSMPLRLDGTSFQKQVWEALRNIPYGETRSYAEIAEAIGNPKAVRAVGGANNKNPIMIIVPCHRVIGKDGKMVGFGAGIEVKEALLAVERYGNKNATNK